MDTIINRDLRWLMSRMLEEFPGLITDDDVNGGDLVQFLSYQLKEMEHLKILAPSMTGTYIIPKVDPVTGKATTQWFCSYRGMLELARRTTKKDLQ